METEIQNELARLLNCIKESNCKPINFVNLLSESVMNVLWKYVAGKCTDTYNPFLIVPERTTKPMYHSNRAETV